MSPSFQVGDRLVVEKISYRFHPPGRQDVIVFNAPPDLRWRNIKVPMVKRVIGVPGDKVQIRQGQVLVNGQILTEPYLTVVTSGSFGPTEVPQGQYFVLGDNREHSYDSRYWGYVPESYVLGRSLPYALRSPFSQLEARR